MEAMAWLIFRGYFYPRPPRGGRRGKKMVGVASNKFLSTPSARRATLSIWTSQSSFCISIHALREEGDLWPHPPSRRCRISIHALREEGDTLATHQDQTLFISIHALREEGDHRHRGRWRHRRISIHALREEGDAQTKLDIAKQAQFLSTPSARRATPWPTLERLPEGRFLSTPSARRATKGAQLLRARRLYFYPRPPRGGRQPRSGLHGRQC